MNEFKTLWNKYLEAEKLANEIDEAFELDPENEEIESKWDEAYKAEYEAKEQVTDKIVEMTSGMIDKKTANTMILAKRKELVELISRIA